MIKTSSAKLIPFSISPVLVHRDGIPSHLYPNSTKQVELHPSPFRVFLSSHLSEGLINPSPHLPTRGTQVEGDPVQL